MADFEVDFFYTRGKRKSGEGNEDSFTVNRHCVAVVDGATAKNQELIEGKSPGLFAAEVLTKTISHLSAPLDAESLVRLLSQALLSEYIRATGVSPLSLPAAFRPSASFVAYLPQLNELVMVGDCQALVDSAHHKTSQVVDGVAAQVRANYYQQRLQQGESLEDLAKLLEDPSRKIIAPILMLGASLRNQEGNLNSFSVIDGGFVPMSLVRRITVPPFTKNIVLASDGYPRLFQSFTKTEHELKTLLLEDPLCIGVLKECKGALPSLSSFDDRTFVALSLR